MSPATRQSTVPPESGAAHGDEKGYIHTVKRKRDASLSPHRNTTPRRSPTTSQLGPQLVANRRLTSDEASVPGSSRRDAGSEDWSQVKAEAAVSEDEAVGTPLASEEDELDEKPSEALIGLATFLGSGGDRRGWTYELQVIQHPQRARACGFGDKDRRPLSPPPIVRLWIRDENGRPVNTSDIAVHFLVLIVDLWSAQGMQERNVVMHPSAGQQRQTSPRKPSVAPSDATQAAPLSRPTTGNRPDTAGGQSSSWPGGAWRFSPGQSSSSGALSPGPSPLSRFTGRDTQIPSHLPVPTSPVVTGWSPPSTARPNMSRSHTHINRLHPPETEPTRPVTAPSTSLPRPLPLGTSPTRGVNLPPLASIQEHVELSHERRSDLTLPAIRDINRLSASTSLSRDARSSWSTQSSHLQTPDVITARPSVTSFPWYPSSSADTRPTSSWSDRPWTGGSTSGRPSTAENTTPKPGWRPGSASENHPYLPSSRTFADATPAFPTSPTTAPYDASVRRIPTEYPQMPPRTPESRRHSSQATANYSRVLVGSLTAVCQKLIDDQDDPGLFFFAHDLGVRTEGSFVLKFSLMSLTPLMQPGMMPGQHTGVLAEVFSEPFTVYSAKRFPGVIPTTDLTRLFASQNVRLPTRQKRTTSAGQGGDGSGEDEE